LSPDETRYFVGVDGFQCKSGERPDLAAVDELDPVYQEIKEYANHIESAEHGGLLTPNIVPMIGAGGWEMIEGRQTQADLEAEELHSRHEITSLISIKYPANHNKDIRALKSTTMQAVDDKAGCMLFFRLLEGLSGQAVLLVERGAGARARVHGPPSSERSTTTGTVAPSYGEIVCD
jgi:hypothetical protein